MNIFNLKHHNLSSLKNAISFFTNNKLNKFAEAENSDSDFLNICMTIGNSLARLSDLKTIERECKCRNPKRLLNTMEWGLVMLHRNLDLLGSDANKLPAIKPELLRILKKINEEFKSNGFYLSNRYFPGLDKMTSLAV